jgi:fructosamine-3-kinase
VLTSFVKHFAPTDPGSPHLEAAGLAWLAETTADGGVGTPAIYAIGHRRLEMERIATSPPTGAAARAFGRALAITHAAGAPHFGAPPPGWRAGGSIGRAPLEFAPPGDAPVRWGAFYARYRVDPYVAMALDNGGLNWADRDVFRRLGQRLEAGDFDAPQPALAGPVARIHGDLWAGNILWTERPRDDHSAGWSGAVVIDPAAHGGHAETDLAMLALFGIAGLGDIIAGYEGVSALAPGWRGRVALHQLHPLLVHAALFGPSYGTRATAVARHYVES